MKQSSFTILITVLALLVSDSLGQDSSDSARAVGFGEEGESRLTILSGDGFEACKISRTYVENEESKHETLVYSARTSPVPRLRMRYFAGELPDEDVENNDFEEDLEVVAEFPGLFLFTETDGILGYSTSDDITQRFSFRSYWYEEDNLSKTLYSSTTQTSSDGTVCRLLINVANGISFEFLARVDNPGKVRMVTTVDPLIFFNASGGSEDRVAMVFNLRHKDGLGLEENSKINKARLDADEYLLLNDFVLGSTSQKVSAYVNWIDRVWPTYTSGNYEPYNLSFSYFSSLDVPFDRISSTKDDIGSYTLAAEDAAVENRLMNRKTLVFAIDSPMTQEITWNDDDNALGITPLTVRPNTGGESSSNSPCVSKIAVAFIAAIIVAVLVL